MADEDAVRAAFVDQARSCHSLGSPFTARLCELAAGRLDHSTEVGRAILNWPGDPSSKADSVSLRLAGSLHRIVLTRPDSALAGVYPPNAADDDALWRAVDAAFRGHEGEILAQLRSAPQTNEVRRSAALFPGFLTIARLTGLPLVLSEVGASAGLNLFWDRYGYRLRDLIWGEADAPISLEPDWHGPLPALAPIRVEGRAACDLRPFDASSSEDRTRALSYIWADQTDRLARTKAAFAVVADTPGIVEKADALSFLERRLGAPWENAVHIVFHTIAWQYFPEETARKGRALIEAAGAAATASAPLAWLRLEGDGREPGAALMLTLWPSGEEYCLARADFHGRWVTWFGWPGEA